MLSNKAYDILKAIAVYIAPFATFIGAVCIIWGVPYSEQITATLAAFNTLIGALLGKSSAEYHKAKDNAEPDDEEAEKEEE